LPPKKRPIDEGEEKKVHLTYSLPCIASVTLDGKKKGKEKARRDTSLLCSFFGTEKARGGEKKNTGRNSRLPDAAI